MRGPSWSCELQRGGYRISFFRERLREEHSGGVTLLIRSFDETSSCIISRLLCMPTPGDETRLRYSLSRCRPSCDHRGVMIASLECSYDCSCYIRLAEAIICERRQRGKLSVILPVQDPTLVDRL